MVVRIILLASVKADESGVHGLLALRGGKPFSRVHLSWDSVSAVEANNLSIYFLCASGRKLELNMAFFGGENEVVLRLRELAPSVVIAMLEKAISKGKLARL